MLRNCSTSSDLNQWNHKNCVNEDQNKTKTEQSTYLNLMMLLSNVNDDGFSTTETAADDDVNQVRATGSATLNLSENIVWISDCQSADNWTVSVSI